MLSVFNGLDEVIRLHDGSVRLDLDDILVNNFAISYRLSSDRVNHIDLAVSAFISLIIKEYLLSPVIRLIDNKYLASISFLAGSIPSEPIILNAHR